MNDQWSQEGANAEMFYNSHAFFAQTSRYLDFFLIFTLLISPLTSNSQDTNTTNGIIHNKFTFKLATNGLIVIIGLEGVTNAWISRSGQGIGNWSPAKVGQTLYHGDRLYTGEGSRMDHSHDKTNHRPHPGTQRISSHQNPSLNPAPTIFNLFKGRGFFFHRGKPVDIKVNTRAASAAIRGTEFAVEVTDDEQMILTLFDGIVDLTNTLGNVTLINGEQAVALPNSAPFKTLALNPTNSIQWGFYYPGILSLTEIPLSQEALDEISDSLEAYRNGNIGKALSTIPEDRLPKSAAETLYLASLFLTIGEVERTGSLLNSIEDFPIDENSHSDRTSSKFPDVDHCHGQVGFR